MLKRVPTRQRGATLVEVLIAVLITGFGLLALAQLQTRMTQAQFEAFERTQAIGLLDDMAQRIGANTAKVLAGTESYVTASALGTGDTGSGCATATTRAARDLCDWGSLLRGTTEQLGTDKVGAMIGGRGCVEQVQAANPANCQPAILRVTVAWQGMSKTVVPGVSCAAGAYGDDDALRRAMSLHVTIMDPKC